MKSLRSCIAAVLVLISAAAPARAQENLRLVEQDIKVGLLYNFLNYTRWPSRPSGAIILCVYGRDPLSGRLALMAGRTVNQRAIELRIVRDLRAVDACSLLYVNAEEQREWPRLRALLVRHDVLTVSDFSGFARAGGMIEFGRVEGRIAVLVNAGEIESANLQVQDRLLQLVSIVETSPR